LTGLKLKLPGGTEHDIQAAIVRWSLDAGVTLDIAGPPIQSSGPKEPRKAGMRLDALDHYDIGGTLSSGVRVSSGYVIPERTEDEYGMPRWTRTIEGELLHLGLAFLKFEQDREPSSMPMSVREGILKCSADLPYGETEEVSRKSAYGAEFPSHLIVATGQLSDGYHFFLRRMTNCHVQCRITGPDDGRIEDMSHSFALALELVTGAHCRWVSWREETKGGFAIFLGEPPYDPSIRFPLMHSRVKYDDFKKFIRLVAETLSKQPDLRKGLSLPELAWPPKGAYLNIIALLSAVVAEALLRSFCNALPGTGSVKPVEEDQLSSFGALLNQGPFADHALSGRVSGMLDMLRQVRPTDVLYAVRSAKPQLFVDDEIKAWKQLRHPAAHGKLDSSAPDFLRQVALVCNLINKIIMCVVGYEGQFVDYSTIDWGLNHFGQR